MSISQSGTATVTREELACICACLAMILEDGNFRITNVTKKESKWKKISRQMMLEQSKMLSKWR
ncbi:hypothetical protein Csac_3026 [Caldicellulosiruptor saccharolyticus DSM 8903]|uniref:Uncharacterized protein n=1 Tax=Caldicellulosiruptor saccharolyticus (strain ATCC 43494 / DSM 8903 / Tp8T 6331) TaxID=351627 RepID=G2JCH2_CALS8|nr:hypothetical protein [Caldicellulosiruptor saccharolyticus]AEN71922.1 hypothetical protein Csac_3026 [Caldicellulosiruptor saccharolyticus DSM 8903]